MFWWKGKCSQDMGLIVEEMPDLETADLNYQEVNIIGRNGSFFIESGMQNVEKVVTVHYIGSNLEKLVEWLRGHDYVEFDNLKGHRYKAVITNKISITEIVRNKLARFPIIFTCMPCAYLTEGDTEIVLKSQPTVLNCVKCSADSYPIITITGKGTCNFRINSENMQVDLTPLNGEEFHTVTVYTEDKVATETERVFDDFPKLTAGENTISWNGIVKEVKIIPKWRALL